MFPRTEMLDLVVVDGHASGIVTRDLVTGEIESPRRRRRRARHRRLRQRLLPLDQRQGLQRHRHLARLQARRVLRQSLLHADPPDLHPGERRLSVQADADVRIAAQRRPRLGAEEKRRHAPPDRDSRRRARLLPGAQVSELRQPRAARHRLARRQGSVRRRPRRRPGRPRRLSRFRRRHQARSARQVIREQVRQPLRHVRADHRRERLQDADAHLSRRPLHHGRPLGGLQPDEQRPRPVRARRSELLRPRREPPRRQRARCRAWPTATSSSPTPSATTSPRPSRRRSPTDHAEFKKAEAEVSERIKKLLAIKGKRTVVDFHRELGKHHVGQMRHGPQRRRACSEALAADPATARGVLEERQRARQRRRAQPGRWNTPAASPTSWSSANCSCLDALQRDESCGGHFREEYQTPDGEAKRDDDKFRLRRRLGIHRHGATDPRRAADEA